LYKIFFVTRVTDHSILDTADHVSFVSVDNWISSLNFIFIVKFYGCLQKMKIWSSWLLVTFVSYQQRYN